MIVSLIIISIVIVLINIIINYRKIEELLSVIKIKKIFITLFQVIATILICIVIINRGVECFNNFKMQKEIEQDIKKIAEQQKVENEYYNKMMKLNYEKQNYNKPYIPDGFTYVEGDWNTGYVIQDGNGNQYVWVPCTNQDIEGVTKLEKRNFVHNAYMSKDLCYDSNYKEFIESALENGGFYIARFEIGQDENNTPVSKKSVKIWTNIHKEEIIEKISIMNQENSEVTIQLMNSYSYDTAFEWIKNTNNQDELKYEIIENDENGNRYTGTKKYNNIYDLFDTTYEITTEIYSDNSIVSRGPSGIYNDIMNGANTKRLDNRGSLLWEKADNLGFRTILYK